MNEEQLKDIHRLLKENNYMLKVLISYFRHDNNTDFINNILANIIANKMENIKNK